MVVGLVNRSAVVSAMVLAATIIPLAPMLMPDAATACQEWAAVPGTQVAAPICTVGTFQLTSATSVEPGLFPPNCHGAMFQAASNGAACDPNDFWSSWAKAVSSGVYFTPPTRFRFSYITFASVSLSSVG